MHWEMKGKGTLIGLLFSGCRYSQRCRAHNRSQVHIPHRGRLSLPYKVQILLFGFYILRLPVRIDSAKEGVDTLTKWHFFPFQSGLFPFGTSILLIPSLWKGFCKCCESREEDKAENSFCGHHTSFQDLSCRGSSSDCCSGGLV